MDQASCEKLIAPSTAQIAQLAAVVSALAQGAAACASGGNSSGAVRILLDVEPHLGDTQRLLDMASFANRTMEAFD